MTIFKIDGEENPADIMTKPQTLLEIIRRVGTVGMPLKTRGGIKNDDSDGYLQQVFKMQ